MGDSLEREPFIYFYIKYLIIILPVKWYNNRALCDRQQQHERWYNIFFVVFMFIILCSNLCFAASFFLELTFLKYLPEI